MATWVTHLMIADTVMKELPWLRRHEFCVGSIAPDCNVENREWSGFTPPREVTHWMSGVRKTPEDCGRFLREYVHGRTLSGEQEESFLLGYYAHLVADAEFQRFVRDEDRVRSVWKRICAHPELSHITVGMAETWDSAKRLIGAKEWKKDIGYLEQEYLDTHPDSGYLTEILPLQHFPDYLDYLPRGAIVRKVKVMAGIPPKELSRFPFLCISREEYAAFLDNAVTLILNGINQYKK